MFTSTQSFIDDYRRESAGTQKLLDTLTDDSLNQEITPGFRTLGRLAFHLSHSRGLLEHAGLKFKAPFKYSEPPASAAEIAALYAETVNEVLDAVQTQWPDEKLSETVDMFGQKWTYGSTLYTFIKHEAHHRGQITILMRQAGLPVAGVYGPSKEEEMAFSGGNSRN